MRKLEDAFYLASSIIFQRYNPYPNSSPDALPVVSSSAFLHTPPYNFKSSPLFFP